MIRAMFRVMGLGLWRDRGALLIAFALPSVVFAIFASIFAGATEGELYARVGMVLHTEDKALVDFAERLESTAEINVVPLEGRSPADLEKSVRHGEFDAGLVIEGETGLDQTFFTVIAEPSRRIAAVSLDGVLRQQLAIHAPEVLARRYMEATEPLVGGFSEAQRSTAEQYLQALAYTERGEPEQDSAQQPLVAFSSVQGDTQASVSGLSGITYYAGATAMLFLLLSAVNAGMVSLEERQAGIAERLLLSGWAKARLLIGRFLFLLCLGILQASVIFLVARFGFELPVADAWLEVAAVTAACAAASAGIALLVLSLCSTTQQATSFSSFFVLIISAMGGSMVPRFMMPEWLQTVSWFTPNAWAIDGFYGAIMRGDSVSNTLHACAILSAIGLGGLLLAALPLRKTR